MILPIPLSQVEWYLLDRLFDIENKIRPDKTHARLAHPPALPRPIEKPERQNQV